MPFLEYHHTETKEMRGHQSRRAKLRIFWQQKLWVHHSHTFEEKLLKDMQRKEETENKRERGSRRKNGGQRIY